MLRAMYEEEMDEHRCVMIAAFGGWNDAGEAATDVVRHLVETYDAHEIGHICCDGFYDYQVNRPMQCNVDGHRRIVWPETTFYQAEVSPSLTLVLSIGPEPNFHWCDYCQRMIAIAEDCDVDEVISLGAMFDECPHTRPLPVTVTTPSDDLCGEDSYTGPVGITTVLAVKADELGFETTSAWVSIPQYLSNDSCPEGALRLLRAVETKLDVNLKGDELEAKARRWHASADMLMRCNDMLDDYVRRLEQSFDRNTDDGKGGFPMLSPDQARRVVEQAEAFLRKSHGDA